MEPFVVSARKYRPQTFDDVVGQQAITSTLQNAIKNDHLAQALLFCGPRGVGKTTCARILAKMINEDGTEKKDEDFAFNIFELDAASNNSVDDIRNLIDQVRIPPQTGKYKVYIIDEVHMLSQSAFNAFLKTLEEPPKHTIFILATTEKHKIIPTILSRCQIFDFKRITVKDAAKYLKYIAENQDVDAEDDALHIIAQKADGAMRDALSIFDRVVSFSGKKLTRKAVTENLNVLDFETYFSFTDLILEHNIPKILLLLNKTLAQGFDGHHVIIGLASHFRDLLVCRHKETIELLEVGDSTKEKYLEQSQKTSESFLLRALKVATTCDLQYKASKNQRLLVELALMQLASIDFDGEKKNPESIELNGRSIELLAPASFYKNATNNRDISNSREEPPKDGLPHNDLTHDSTTKDGEISTEDLSATKPVKSSQEGEVIVAKPQISVSIKARTNQISGLSISSLKAKKEHRLNKKVDEIREEDLPHEPFTEEKLQQYWAEYVKKLSKEGKRILASNLGVDLPKVKDQTTIWVEMPNGSMKKEIERAQGPLLQFLKEKLNNYVLELEILVNEESAKKFAYTPEEKYEKLRKKNPVIDLLRKEFDLDL